MAKKRILLVIPRYRRKTLQNFSANFSAPRARKRFHCCNLSTQKRGRTKRTYARENSGGIQASAQEYKRSLNLRQDKSALCMLILHWKRTFSRYHARNTEKTPRRLTFSNRNRRKCCGCQRYSSVTAKLYTLGQAYTEPGPGPNQRPLGLSLGGARRSGVFREWCLQRLYRKMP